MSISCGLGARQADGVGLIRVDGKLTTARRVAWELEHGPLSPGARIGGCADPACVRVSHLTIIGMEAPAVARRAARGSGSKRMVRPGVWKLTVSAGRYIDGSLRRAHRTIDAGSDVEASQALAEFVSEVRSAAPPDSRIERDITVDEAVERYLTDHLQRERGREPGTLDEYRGVHSKWFSPEIGGRRLRDIDEAIIDRLFGRMREAGLSRSRRNAARNLYAPMFRWARRRGIVARNPMAEFQLPTSRHVASEHLPLEAQQLSRYLATAVELAPDIAPVMTLGAVTGMRRGELVSIRRSGLDVKRGRRRVDTAIAGKRVKTTKTRVERDVALDAATVSMLKRHCEQMDERAALFGVEVADDGFVCSASSPTARCRCPPSTSLGTCRCSRSIWASPTRSRRPSRSRTRPSACSDSRVLQGRLARPARRRQFAAMICELPIQLCAVATGLSGRSMPSAREQLVGALAEELLGRGVESWVIEAIGQVQEKRDRRVIADAVRRVDLTAEFVYDHRPPHSDPLLERYGRMIGTRGGCRTRRSVVPSRPAVAAEWTETIVTAFEPGEQALEHC